MRNIWLLYVNDLRHLFRNVVSCIIAVGLVVLPSIFAWYNVIACWNVFDNTGKLTVAVANSDAGYESELAPLRINIGEEVVSALRANDEIGWVVTDEDDAKDGVAAGRYYAAIVIPPEFSRDMMTFYTEDAEHAQIAYYSNEKRNAIAPVITSKGATSVSTAVNEAFAKTLADVSLGMAKSLSDYLDEADAGGALSGLADRVDASAGMMTQAAGVLSAYSSVVRELQGILGDVSSLSRNAQMELVRVEASVEGAADKAADAASALRRQADAASAKLEEAASRLDSLADKALSLIGEVSPAEQERIASKIAEVESEVEAARATVRNEVMPGLLAVRNDSRALEEQLSDGWAALEAATGSVASSAESVSASLDGAAGKLDAAAAELSERGSDLGGIASRLKEAVDADDLASVRDLLSADTSSLAAAIAAPVAVERIAVFPVDSFGSAMAPFYTSLALFVGSLLIVVAVRPSVSKRALRKIPDPKPYQTFLGRFGVMGTVSLAQSTVMGLGNLLFLQVQVDSPALFMLCFWASGLVFTFIIYALVAAFANLGKAVAVLLLIVQVTGCGGSYPLQILPDFIQRLSPWLPLTHTVAAMRSAMFGMYQSDFWVEMGCLLLFLVPAAVLGLVLRRPLSAFMGWYVKQVDKSELVS